MNTNTNNTMEAPAREFATVPERVSMLARMTRRAQLLAYFDAKGSTGCARALAGTRAMIDALRFSLGARATRPHAIILADDAALLARPTAQAPSL